MLSIKGKDKGAVLAALYNASRPQGLGMLHFDAKPMTLEEGRELVADHDYFDYLKGRVMKLRVSEDELDERLYDRDNGPGAAEVALRQAGLLSE